jgi:hypothetical protein
MLRSGLQCAQNDEVERALRKFELPVTRVPFRFYKSASHGFVEVQGKTLKRPTAWPVYSKWAAPVYENSLQYAYDFSEYFVVALHGRAGTCSGATDYI